MHISRESRDPSAIPADVRYVYGVGPVVKIELQAVETGTFLEAEVGRARFAELDLKLGEIVFVTPQNLKVFAEDYSI
jgi:sulfate transport system ATP-binding protein